MTGEGFEPGWRAEVLAGGELLLRRTSPPARPSAHPERVSPLLLEVFNSLFMSVAEQMGATLANTAVSVNIKEPLDFSCAVFDAEGGLVANAPHLPVHLGSMGASVRAVLERRRGDLRPGGRKEVYELGHVAVEMASQQGVRQVVVIAVTELMVAGKPVPEEVVGQEEAIVKGTLPGDVFAHRRPPGVEEIPIGVRVLAEQVAQCGRGAAAVIARHRME